MYFLKRLLTWWNSQTLGTQIFTARKGVKVGEDDQGNIYYHTRDDKRRWVIFNGEAEASRKPQAFLTGTVSPGIESAKGGNAALTAADAAASARERFATDGSASSIPTNWTARWKKNWH